jgi:hypothetical protein
MAAAPAGRTAAARGAPQGGIPMARFRARARARSFAHAAGSSRAAAAGGATRGGRRTHMAFLDTPVSGCTCLSTL